MSLARCQPSPGRLVDEDEMRLQGDGFQRLGSLVEGLLSRRCDIVSAGNPGTGPAASVMMVAKRSDRLPVREGIEVYFPCRLKGRRLPEVRKITTSEEDYQKRGRRVTSTLLCG